MIIGPPTVEQAFDFLGKNVCIHWMEPANSQGPAHPGGMSGEVWRILHKYVESPEIILDHGYGIAIDAITYFHPLSEQCPEGTA